MVTCMTIASFNAFIAITGLNVIPQPSGLYMVTSEQPAYYELIEDNFCLVRNKS